MQTIRLGRGNLTVSRLAFGGWRIAGTWEPSQVSPEREAAGRRAVRAAVDAGFTFFDLADIYCHGRCEVIFGQALRESPVLRDRLIVATKCGIRFKGEGGGEAPYRYDFSADHILRSCEGSLKRMGLETIDLFMLHRPDFLCDPAEVASAFAQLLREGKVREFGVSNFRPSQLSMLQRACPMPLVVNQVEANLLRLDVFNDGTLDQCLESQITPLAWSPLAGGRLVAANTIDLNTADHAHRIHVREVLDQVAREYHTTRTGIALAWLLRHPAGLVPIVGTTQPDRLPEALAALDVRLSREDWYRLLEVALGHRLP